MKSASRVRLIGALCGLSILVALALPTGQPPTVHADDPRPTTPTTFQPGFYQFPVHPQPDAATVAASIPSWTGSFSYHGTTYGYRMVGSAPVPNAGTTIISTTIVALHLVFASNPSANFNGADIMTPTVNSPIFQNAPYTSGTSQYGDALQRANFWDKVSTIAPNWHVRLGQPSQSQITLTVPIADGGVYQSPGGQLGGIVDVYWLDSQLKSLLTSLPLSAGTLPIFLSHNVFAYFPNKPGVIGGYHTAMGPQTYIYSEYNDPYVYPNHTFGLDINSLSHEVAEWYNNPFNSNVVPSWTVPSQPLYGCSNALEVGDPLAGVSFVVNGYHPQDETFLAWFSRQSPSTAINGQYTYLGTYATYSGSCSAPTVVATVTVGSSPGGVGANPTTNRIYVATYFSNTVSVIDGSSNAVVTTVPVGAGPYGVGVNPTTNRIYVTNLGGGNTVSVIDGSSNAVVTTVPVGVGPYFAGVNPKTNRIYVSNYGSNTVSVISGITNTVVATVPVGSGPYGVGVNPTTNRIYVASVRTNAISVIDGSSNTVVATVPVGVGPYGVSANHTTNRIYVANQGSNTVSVVDGSSNTVVATVPVGSNPYGVGVNPTTNRIYVANASGTVSVVDGGSNTVVATVPVGSEPTGVDVNLTTNRIYVANQGSNTVSVIQDSP